MARVAQRFQVIEMVKARQGVAAPAHGLDVVDLYSLGGNTAVRAHFLGASASQPTSDAPHVIPLEVSRAGATAP